MSGGGHPGGSGARRISVALAGSKEELERRLKKSQLFHALKHRPSYVEQHFMQIVKDEPLPVKVKEPLSVAPVPAAAVDDSPEGEQMRLLEQYNYEKSVGFPATSSIGLSVKHRSPEFILIRVLLKFISDLHEIGDLTSEEKMRLKELLAGLNPVLLKAAKRFDDTQDVANFRTTLKRLAAAAIEAAGGPSAEPESE